jgi:16S rRNA (adenine1518-N6/adenine1519-N6)-dimethyltransferase
VGLVPANVFVPRPKVESALVRIVRHSVPPVAVDDPDRLFALVRSGFATRRKMLRQSLRPILGDRSTEVLERAGIAPTARAEELDLLAWVAVDAAARTAAHDEG